MNETPLDEQTLIELARCYADMDGRIFLNDDHTSYHLIRNGFLISLTPAHLENDLYSEVTWNS